MASRATLLLLLLVDEGDSGTPGSVQRSFVHMKVSNLFHGNVLPQYRWMCKMSGAEFAESGYCKVAGTGYNVQGPINPPCSAQIDPQCPDWAFEGLWADLRTMTLPYTVQDEYDRAHTPTDVPVLTLENDELSAVVTPQWGGRLWSLTSKVTGRELFYNNRHFQPTNDALRQAYQQGGSEWNFGPQIGHMSDTLTDVFAAKLDTERGTVLRVYAMERTTTAVWQVDMLLGNQSTLWLHVKLTNPRPEPIVGYWWTNVGVQVDTDGSNQTRIITPATHWLSDAARAALPPWPFFYERSGALMMMSATSFNSSQGDWTHPDFPQFGTKPTDMSFAFNWWEKRDVWFDLVASQRRVRYNGWVDNDGGLMLHGHPNNGTKAWMWGTAPDEVFWQNFGGGKDDLEHVPVDQHNMYTELQTGVMPTQYLLRGTYDMSSESLNLPLLLGLFTTHFVPRSRYQGFPLPPQTSRQWTEFFTTDALDSPTLEALMSPDYHGNAIPTADQLLDAKGLGGNHTETFDDMDTWFKAHVADRKPLDKEIMHRPERWGAVEELRRGKPLAEGALFPNTAGEHGDNGPLQNETQAWLELVSDGTFGKESLRSHAISFQAGGYRDLQGTSWLATLQSSAAKHGATWLHDFHIGVILLERTLVPGRFSPLFSAIFNRKMQKLPLFSVNFNKK